MNSAAVGNSGGGGDAAGRGDLQDAQFPAALAAGAAGVPHPPVAAWCRALAEFPGGEDGSRGWLLHKALAIKLQLPGVAGFRPGLLEAARDKLSGRPRLTAVWDKWVAGRGARRNPRGAQRRARPRSAAAAPPPPGGGVLAVWIFGRASARIFW